MNKSIFFNVLLLIVFVSSCVTVPYVRSDIFVDSQAVKNIYIMPIVTEVTLDSSFDISREELQISLKETIGKIKDTLELELAKRGYNIGGYSKEFYELDQNKHEDELVKLAVQEFLHSTGKDHDKTTEDFVETLFEEVLIKGVLTVTDKDGNVKKIKNEEMNKTKEKMNPLVAKTLAIREIFPKHIDTILYMEIKSFIAKRGLWRSLKEKSTVTVRIKLVNINSEKIIFSYQTLQDRSDILHWKSLEKALSNVLAKIPVKLEYQK